MPLVGRRVGRRQTTANTEDSRSAKMPLGMNPAASTALAGSWWLETEDHAAERRKEFA
jgi:hypothetical protein